jgi:hypothetical protein
LTERKFSMSFWDDICDDVLHPLGSLLVDAVEGAGRVIDSAVNNVVIDGICGGLDTALDFAKENPGKATLVVAATAVTGGAAFAAAGPIAAAIGGTGVLGTAGTGAVISELTGIYLTNASLAALGGGTLAAGGAGMAGGTAVVATMGAAVGAMVSSGAVALTPLSWLCTGFPAVSS